MASHDIKKRTNKDPKKIDIDELIEILPELIKTNDRIKGAIITALSGVMPTTEDIKAIVNEMKLGFEQMQENTDRRFEQMQENTDRRFEQMQENTNRRFEEFQQTISAVLRDMQENTDRRFEQMQENTDRRFEEFQQTISAVLKDMQENTDKRFEQMQENTDKRFKDMQSQFNKMDKKLDNLLSILGRPFEQFCRNVIVKILEAENIKGVKLEPKTIKNPNKKLLDANELEFDAFSLDPPIVAEITSVLRDLNKVHKFLKKKEILEEKYEKKFRGFFVAGAVENFSQDQKAELITELAKHNVTFINL